MLSKYFHIPIFQQFTFFCQVLYIIKGYKSIYFYTLNRSEPFGCNTNISNRKITTKSPKFFW